MKVLDLRCANGHSFEGWFGSEDDFLSQNGSGRLSCPLCNDNVITRLLSAPRLNLSGAKAPARASDPATAAEPTAAAAHQPSQASAASAPISTALAPADMQAAFLNAVRSLMARTEDVGPKFAEEARRIHYGEAEQRGIRGQATPEERVALSEEGIETMAIPVPAALKSTLQ